METDSRKIENVVAIAALAGLGLATFLVLKPFLPAVLLAVILTISTWPLYEKLTQALRGKASASAAIVVTIFAFVLAVPLFFLISSIGSQIPNVTEFIETFDQDEYLVPPKWVSSLPIIGSKLSSYWTRIMQSGSEIVGALRPYALKGTQWLLELAATFGVALGNLAITLLVTFFFLRDGKILRSRLIEVMEHIAGSRAADLVEVAGLTLKGVVYGIVGTAILQGVLAWIGFQIVGLSAPAVLGLITFFLSFIPIGPPVIWIPAGIWLLSNDRTGAGIFLLCWGTIVVSGADNIVKPYLISKGSDLPIILIFLGVIGGAIQFGFEGIFLGPTVLALMYSLISGWIVTKAKVKL